MYKKKQFSISGLTKKKTVFLRNSTLFVNIVSFKRNTLIPTFL